MSEIIPVPESLIIKILSSLYQARIEAGDDHDKAFKVLTDHASMQIAQAAQKHAMQELEKVR